MTSSSRSGERHYLWRAVDQEGDVIDILVQRYRRMEMPSVERNTARYANKRAEVSHPRKSEAELRDGVREADPVHGGTRG